MGSLIIRMTLLSLLLLASMWWSSLAMYDAEKMKDASRWRHAVLENRTPLAWRFDSPSELKTGHGLDSFEWSDGTVSGDMTDPYFYLNLEGRSIDARRYTLLRMRLYSANGSYLQLFHGQFRDDQLFASDPIPLRPGWQTVELDLAELSWHRKHLDDSQPSEPSRWGTLDGAVSDLRIDPVQEGAFAVDDIALLSQGPLIAEGAGEVRRFETLHDPLFDTMRRDRDTIWCIAHDAYLRTPESAHRLRQAVAREFPSAIVFPFPPGEHELTGSAARDRQRPGLLPMIVFVAAMLVLQANGRFGQPWRALLEVAALIAMFEAFVFWQPELPSLASAFVALLIVVSIWRLAPNLRGIQWHWGDRRAWMSLSPLLALALLLLILFPDQRPEADPLPRTLLSYFAWALLQQFVICELVFRRLRTVFGPAALVLAAALFGYMHFPNFALMAGTFALGLVLLRVYERRPNLFAVAATHALLAVGFNALASQFFWLSRTVGLYFLVPL